jgi:cytosine/adenosine deaminase-related metal-dependent hydrolase
VNTHVHTSQQLARGIADDVDLVTWLHGRIWPYESHMTEEDSYASTLLCGIELIRSGVSRSVVHCIVTVLPRFRLLKMLVNLDDNAPFLLAQYL